MDDMPQQDDGLTNAERNAIKWITVKERFEKTDDGCACPSCRTIRLLLDVK
ncbi:hypothetical protein D3C84_1022310 [compost metagenome]